ncbi:hypothetical protein ACCS64_36485, partial [Rhizobium ruizarguesonis]
TLISPPTQVGKHGNQPSATPRPGTRSAATDFLKMGQFASQPIGSLRIEPLLFEIFVVVREMSSQWRPHLVTI